MTPQGKSAFSFHRWGLRLRKAMSVAQSHTTMTWWQGNGILGLSSSALFYHQGTEATVRLHGSTFPLPGSGPGHVTPSLGLGFLICKTGTWEPSKTMMSSIPRTEWILSTYYFHFIMKNTSCSQQTEERPPRSSPSNFWRHRGPGQESPAPHRSKAVLSPPRIPWPIWDSLHRWGYAQRGEATCPSSHRNPMPVPP